VDHFVPNGRVPVLVDGDLTLWESNVINIHLAEKAASSLWPGGRARLEIPEWKGSAPPPLG
jgi:glutathione S-transferase